LTTVELVVKNSPKISPIELEFRTEEYKSLRSEIVVLYGLTFQTERNAVAALVIIYGYLLSDKIVGSQIAIGFWAFPPLIALYAILRLRLFYKGMVSLGDFIAVEIESRLLISGNGWETSLRKNSSVTVPEGVCNPFRNIHAYVAANSVFRKPSLISHIKLANRRFRNVQKGIANPFLLRGGQIPDYSGKRVRAFL